MLVACWSAKGGAGTTVVAAALALLSARRSPTGALLADLAGDAPAALGLPEPANPGLAGWLASGTLVPADALGRLEVEVTGGLGLLPRGSGPLAADRAEVLAALLADSARPVVADCGTLRPSTVADGPPTSGSAPPATDGAGERRHGPSGGRAAAQADLDPGAGPVLGAVLARAHRSVLVTRPCYLALRRAMALTPRPTEVIVVREPGRVLSRHDVEHVVRAPVVAEVEVDPGVARTVDAGGLAGRLPRSLARALRDVA